MNNWKETGRRLRSNLTAYASGVIVERFPGVLSFGGVLGCLLDAIHEDLRFALFVGPGLFLLVFHINSL